MLVLAIRNSDDKVMNYRHDAPNPRSGGTIKAVVANGGGFPSDYREYIVPEKDRASIMSAKSMGWDDDSKTVTATPYTDQEEQSKSNTSKLSRTKDELVAAQMYIMASAELGLGASEKIIERDRLNVEYQELKGLVG